MTFRRAANGFIAALVALVALVPAPASAARLVSQSNLVCADVSESPFSVVQNAASGSATLEVTNNDILQVKFKGQGLPGNETVMCAVLCVVDGVLDLFDFEVFSPCGTTTSKGKFTFNGSVPFGGSDPPFEGGCLLSVAAFVVPSGPSSTVVCAPGFGTFEPFTP